MNRRIVRILRTAVVIMMALVFVGCSERGCTTQPHLAIANDTDLPVVARVTGGDQDSALNMLPESKESFEIGYNTVYDVRILSSSFLRTMVNKRDDLRDKFDRAVYHGEKDSRAIGDAMWDLDKQIRAEFKPEKAAASCKAGPTAPPASSGSSAETQVIHLYANITRDSKGNLQLQCGKR